MPNFEIEVGGNIAPITRALQDLKSDLKGFKGELERSTDPLSVAKLNAEIKKTEDEIKRIKGVGPIIGSPAVKGVDQAANSLTNMSRVIQDAPFGFIAIQNNLNPLLESFQRLKAETGSNAGALKALGSVLGGAGGVGIGLSVVSGLVTVAIQKYGSLGNAVDALFGSLSKAAQAQRDVAETFAAASGKAGGEIANIQALLTVARDETLSRSARAEAINKLNKEYDGYLPKLTQENISTKEVTESINKLTASLIRQAKIKGLQDLISKETAKQAELMAHSLGENANWWDNIVAAAKSFGPAGNFFNEQTILGAKRTASEFQDASDRIATFQKFLNELTKEEAVNGTLFDETKLKKGEDLLKKRLEALEKIKKETKDTTALVGIEEAIFEVKVKIAIRDDKKRLSKTEFDQLLLGFQEDLNKAFLNQAISFEAIPKVKFSPVALAEIPKEITDKVSKATGNEKITVTLHDARVLILGRKVTAQIEGKEAINKKLSEEINGALEGLQVDLTASFGEALGEAFSNAIQGNDLGDGLRNAAKQMLSILGSVMQQIGRYVIAAAIKIQLLKKTLEQWAVANPALAILAGVGLIAAGAALKNATFQGPKFAQGGIVTGPTIGLIGEAGKEAIIPLNKLPGLIGQTGGTTVVLNSRLGIDGRTLVAFIEKETTRFNRVR